MRDRVLIELLMKTSPLIWVSIALSTLAVLIAGGMALFVAFSARQKATEGPSTTSNQPSTTATTPQQPHTPGSAFYCDDQYAFGFEYPESWGTPDIFGGLSIPTGSTPTPRTVQFDNVGDFSYLTIGANPPPFGLEEVDITNTQKITVRGVEANWSTNTDRSGNHVALITFERANVGHVIILDFGHPFAKSDDALLQDLLDSWVFACGEPTTTNNQKDLVAARTALTTFFADLEAENYDAAAEKISPDTYDLLAGFNPEETDVTALLKYACKDTQLLQCLVIKNVVKEEALSATEFLFTVTFAKPDGTVYELGPCCGADESTPPTSEFDYHVTKISADDFLILEAPVYHP